MIVQAINYHLFNHKGIKMFNESTLETAIIENLKNQNYEYVRGDDIHKELSDVLIRDDFRNFMMLNYDLTDFEVNSLLRRFDNYTNADLYSSLIMKTLKRI